MADDLLAVHGPWERVSYFPLEGSVFNAAHALDNDPVLIHLWATLVGLSRLAKNKDQTEEMIFGGRCFRESLGEVE